MTIKVTAVNRQLMRDFNENSLLNLIKSKGPLSRTDLAEMSGLSLATISGITNNFIERRLVVENGNVSSLRGRKAGLLEISPDGGYAIGLKLTEYETIGVILNLNADIVYAEHFGLRLRQNPQTGLEAVAQAVARLIENSTVSPAKIIGLGCGLSGLISAEEGRVIDSPNLGWRDVEVSQPLAERTGLPVFIDNDIKCFSIFEKSYGQGQGYPNFLTVTIGRGVGLGIVINGELYRGAHGGAGEFGHTSIVAVGRQCECGKRGCLEAYVNDRGIVTNYLESRARTFSTDDSAKRSQDILGVVEVKEVLERARNGEQAALEAFEQAGTLLGIGLANVVNLFDPERIVMSGEGMSAAQFILEPTRQALYNHTFSHLKEYIQLVVAPTGDESWARGAASLVLNQFFVTPTRFGSSG